MQSIILFFLVIGIVMVAIGYQRQLNKATTNISLSDLFWVDLSLNETKKKITIYE